MGCEGELWGAGGALKGRGLWGRRGDVGQEKPPHTPHPSDHHHGSGVRRRCRHRGRLADHHGVRDPPVGGGGRGYGGAWEGVGRGPLCLAIVWLISVALFCKALYKLPAFTVLA